MKKQWLILGIILLVVLFERFLCNIPNLNLFEKLEWVTYDIRAKIATDEGPFNKRFKHADKNIVIVTLDDYSRMELARNPQLNLGSFPWPRDVWAGITEFIEKGKPKALLFDFLFTELNANIKNDEKFAQILNKYNNVVLATSLNSPKTLLGTLPKGTEIENSNYLPTAKPLNVKIDDKKIDDYISYYTHTPIHDLYTKHNFMGVVNKVEDSDSVIRSSQPIFKLIKNNKVYYMPSLAFAGFLKYAGDDGEILIKNHKLFYKNKIIPIDDEGRVFINWHGCENYKSLRERGHDYEFIPISKILLSEKNEKYIKSSYFKDKIIILGRTEAGTDIHPSAVNPSYAGPEVNATALDNFINDSYNIEKNSRKFVSKMPPFAIFILITLSCAFITYIGLISKNVLLCFINSSIFIFLYLLFCIVAFTYPGIRIWIPMVTPLYYFIMTAIMVFALRFQKELAKKAAIMNMFGKFVSPKVLTNLLKNQDHLVLKSTRKPITVMFCDIKNFTTLSEKCNPEQLVDNLNELFNVIVNVIFKNNGTVDKFIGDCIMAYWGDPIASEDDAYMAIKTALGIKQKVKELGEKNAKENKIVFDVKIGINTGEALLGLSGSQKIMSYTAMGDAVNVASRLESNCSKLNRDILISKSTYESAKSKINAIEVGKISVKGKDEEIEVYEPIELNYSECQRN